MFMIHLLYRLNRNILYVNVNVDYCYYLLMSIGADNFII